MSRKKVIADETGVVNAIDAGRTYRWIEENYGAHRQRAIEIYTSHKGSPPAFKHRPYRTMRNSEGKWCPPNITRDQVAEIAKRYENGERSIELAAEYEITDRDVQNCVHESGGKIRAPGIPKVPPGTRKEILLSWINGAKDVTTADRLGISPGKVRQIRYDAGLKRTRDEYGFLQPVDPAAIEAVLKEFGENQADAQQDMNPG